MCRHRCPVDYFCMPIFEPARQAVAAAQLGQGGNGTIMGCSDAVEKN
jgi:hypothetical protein